MSDIAALVADYLDVWTGAIERKSGAGRGSGKRINLYGIDRLRALILDLAVRGKLVPQDAGDEPASGLLKSIKSTKPGYLSTHGLPKQRALAEPLKHLPFELAASWAWTRLGEIAAYIQRGKSPKYSEGSGVFVVSQRCVQWAGLDLAVAKEISRSSLDNYEPYRFLRPGDLLWNSTGTGTIGRVIALEHVPNGLVCDSHVTVVRCPWMNARYLQFWLASNDVYGQIEVLAAGSTNQIEWTAQLAAAQVVPVPPMAEQQRIVAKVDELMALCDALERESAGAMEAHQALVEILLATLVNSADATDLALDWARLERHFDTLFTTDASIDALKQTILDLAVRGKLVEQDTNDGSATEAISQTKLLKQELIQKKNIRKDKPSLPITEEELPFVAPSSWEWSRIGTVALSTEYGTSRKATLAESGIIVLAMGNIKNGVVDLDAQKSIPQDSEEIPQLILKPGDILYNRTNSYELVGKTGIFRHSNEGYSFASYLIRIRLDERTVEPEFLNMAMNTPYFRQTQVVPKITKQTGQANVSGGAMRNMLIPIPPLAEQNRIVAKVDALMALCDALKARLADAAQTQRHLADAITQRAAA